MPTNYFCSGYIREIIRENRDGKVFPTLNVNWISSEYKILDLHPGPYVVSFSEVRKARVTVKNEKQDKKEIYFKEYFLGCLLLLRLVGGMGSYSYKNTSGSNQESAQILPSFMLNGNYYLNNIHSLNFFEALVIKDSFFKHAGLYLGSDLGKFYDDRLVISTLVGF